MNSPIPRWRPALWRTDAEDDHPSLWMEVLAAALSCLWWAASLVIGAWLIRCFF